MLTSEKLGRRITHFRIARGMTIEELADASSTDYSFLCKIEGGKSNCSIRKLEQLAAVLDVTLRQLFDFCDIETEINIDYKKEITNMMQNMSEDELKGIHAMFSILPKPKKK